MEQTLVILKPDAVQRGLVGEIISRFEKTGLKLKAMKMIEAAEETVKQHYPDELIPIIGGKTQKDWDSYGIKYSQSAEEIGQEIVHATREFMRTSPVVVMILEGGHAVEIVRKMVGSTGPKDSAPGTVRGDYAHLSLGRASMQKRGAANLIHASGSPEEAQREIKLWFKPEEIVEDYKLVHEHLTHA